MASVEIKLNSAGMRELLRSAGMVSEMGRRAAAVAAQAGTGYRSASEAQKNRARGAAFTAGFKAARHEAKTHALIGALSAARR